MLAAGAVLLGAPALALLAREPQAVMLGVSFVRGLGFGLCGVATGALTATAAPERRGEGLGLLGIVSGVPAVSRCPPGSGSPGTTWPPRSRDRGRAGLLPLAVIRWLPGRATRTPPQPQPRGRAGGRGARRCGFR